MSRGSRQCVVCVCAAGNHIKGPRPGGVKWRVWKVIVGWLAMHRLSYNHAVAAAGVAVRLGIRSQKTVCR